MARRRDRRRPSLFEAAHPSAPIPGSLDYGVELRHTLAAVLKATPLSRYEVAARMSELSGQDITKTTLDAWTGESRSAWRFPFEYAAAFEAVCDSSCLQALLARKRGATALAAEEALLKEIERLDREAEGLLEHKRRLMRLLGLRP